MNAQAMSKRCARLVTVTPSTMNHSASAASLPHCPGEIHVPGNSVTAAITPRLAGLKTCLPRTRNMNFEAIASDAMSG
jgi:hypothetical protein